VRGKAKGKGQRKKEKGKRKNANSKVKGGFWVERTICGPHPGPPLEMGGGGFVVVGREYEVAEYLKNKR